MIGNNKFLPLIQYRNKKKHSLINKTNDSLSINPNQSTIKKYIASFSKQSIDLYKNVDYNDYDAINIAKKYIQKFSSKRKLYHHRQQLQRSKKYSFQYKIQRYNNNQSISSTSQLNNKRSHQRYQRTKTQERMIVISPYKKRETKLDSERYYKSITNEDNNKISVDQLPYQEMKDVKSLLFSKQNRDNALKIKQRLLNKYGFMKQNLQKNMQSDLKVSKCQQNYPNKIHAIFLSEKKLEPYSHRKRLDTSNKKIISSSPQNIFQDENQYLNPKNPEFKNRYNDKNTNSKKQKISLLFSQKNEEKSLINKMKKTKFQLKPWVNDDQSQY